MDFGWRNTWARDLNIISHRFNRKTQCLSLKNTISGHLHNPESTSREALYMGYPSASSLISVLQVSFTQGEKRDYSVSLTVFGAFLGPKKRAASSERMSDYDYPL